MRIAGVKLFRYRLPLKRIITTSRGDHDVREGIIIELQDESGHVTYGEAAPLAGFSGETPAQAQEELFTAKPALMGDDLPPGLEKLDGGFESWLGPLALSPSARFAIESAVIEMIAAGNELSLADLLDARTDSGIKVNALLSGSTDEVLSRAADAARDGFTSVKLKIGHLTVGEAIELVSEVRNRIGDMISLRLDANRAYVTGDAMELAHRLMPFNAEYIEEPARNLNQLRKLLGEMGAKARVALDESLLEIRPEDLSPGYPVKAIVIKPTLLGLEKALSFARSAEANGITTVVSSCYESSVGIRVLAAIAAKAGSDVPAGLDTLEVFADDLLEDPVKIAGGCVSSMYIREPVSGIRRDLLEEIADG